MIQRLASRFRRVGAVSLRAAAASPAVPLLCLGMAATSCLQTFQALYGTYEPVRTLTLLAAVAGALLALVLPVRKLPVGTWCFACGVLTWLAPLGIQLTARLVPAFTLEQWSDPYLSLALWAAVCGLAIAPLAFLTTSFVGEAAEWCGAVGGARLAVNFVLLALALWGYGWGLAAYCSPQMVNGTAGALLCAYGLWRLFGSSIVAAPASNAGTMRPHVGSLAFVLMVGLAAGCLAFGTSRIVADLMPAVSTLSFAVVAGWLLGGALALWRAPKSTSVPWLMLGCVAGCLPLLAFPLVVGSVLYVDAYVTHPMLGSLLRHSLLLLTTVVPGIATVGVVRRRAAGTAWAPLAACALVGMAGGWLAGQWIIRPAFSPAVAVLVGAFGLLLAGLPTLLVPAAAPRQRVWRAGFTCSALLAMLVAPTGLRNIQPELTSRALFSTTGFLLHRAGIDLAQIARWDDGKCVRVLFGENGTQTLWKQRVVELQVRDAGIPLLAVSTRPSMTPQSPNEVLQAVLPLTLVDRPQNVLILGGSTGVPLATASDFPIHEVTCVEGDAAMRTVLREHLLPGLGVDLAGDNRLRLTPVSPAVAVRADDQTYDVVLSAPPVSSLGKSLMHFTADYYEAAASRLSADGVFCQRWECIDYGPRPLAAVVRNARHAFREVTLVETGVGEMLILGTNSQEGLIRSGFLDRLSAVQVRSTLAKAGWDWSVVLNLPAYDQAALGEIVAEYPDDLSTVRNCWLAGHLPHETMRWGGKLADVQKVLGKARTTDETYPAPLAELEKLPEDIDHAPPAPSRKSRMLAWIGLDGNDPDLLRRLGEVTAQKQLIKDNPESWWWEYRKTVKDQLQKKPTSGIRLTSAAELKDGLLPDYARRKEYFERLGEAVQTAAPTAEQIEQIGEYAQPYDPLLAPFLHHEVAELYSRNRAAFSAEELEHRLHLIFFAPPYDLSVRNVHQTLEVVLDHPEALAGKEQEFDVIDSLLHVLRGRWDGRGGMHVKSVRLTLRDVETSLRLAHRAVARLDELATKDGVASREWPSRQAVLERSLMRPMQTYRDTLAAAQKKGQMQTQSVLDRADAPDLH